MTSIDPDNMPGWEDYDAMVDNDHMAIWRAENYQSPTERAWLDWIDAVERLLGHDPDGDDSDEARAAGTSDGYSLDGFYDMWKAGRTPQQAVAEIGGHQR